MRVSSKKAKGRRLAQKVADTLRQYFPSLEPDDTRVTPSGVNGPDVQLSPAARRVFPYAVECKNVEKLNVWKALEQAEENRSNLTEPLLVFSRNRSKEYAVIELERFVELVAALEHLRNNE
jgi:hypothetical protein